MAVLNIHDNHLSGGASIIREYNEYNLSCDADWSKLEAELEQLLDRLSSSDALKPAVMALDSAVKHRRLDAVKDTAKRFALDFSSAAFANLASSALLALVR